MYPHFRDLSQHGNPISRDCIFWNASITSRHKYKLPTDKHEISFEDEDGDVETDIHRQESFDRIYETNEWGNESKSGPGSFLNATIQMRKAFGSVIDHLKSHLHKKRIRYFMYNKSTLFKLTLGCWTLLVET